MGGIVRFVTGAPLPSQGVALAGVLLLAAVAVLAWIRGVRQAWSWQRAQEDLLGALPGDPNAADVAALKPNPVKERGSFLKAAQSTPLAEGDIGAFVLRRLPIPGEHSASQAATFLVSIALAFTILGLIVTLYELGAAFAQQGGAPAGQDVTETVVRNLQTPLGSLPLLFLPTGFGLILAAGFSAVQHWMDDLLDQTWQKVDTYTEMALLQNIVQRPETALQKAAGRFEQAAGWLGGTVQQANLALVEIVRQSPAQVMAQLVTTMQAFGGQAGEVARSAKLLADSSDHLNTSLASLPKVSAALSTAADKVTSAADKLSAATDRSQKVIDTLAQTDARTTAALQQAALLGTEIGNLTASTNALQASFDGWSTDQRSQLTAVRKIIEDLQAALHPLLEQWKGMSDHIAANAHATQSALDRVRGEFEESTRKLEGILATQQSTFAGVAREVSESLRQGHALFLHEVSARFDQEEPLYELLGQLHATLQQAQKVVEQGTARVADAADRAVALTPALASYGDSIRDARALVEQIPTVLKQRDDRVQQHFAQVLGELKRPLQNLDRLQRLDALDRLHTEVAGLRQAADAMSRRHERGSIFDLSRSPVLNLFRRGGGKPKDGA